ncbi:MAG: 2-amino-4-hydroxy-6-hydroxymethyldihydropteridine diphosphokinase [Lachnospiraceae bacterium]|nr:2-amino-4-hydroxy-6-hydroxymethyldihydropteridine diphosphokinase [Lachnospiraceae bacterium]
MNNDSIFIKDLEIYAYHGVLKEEKTLGQKFYVSLNIHMDLEKSGKSDKLSDTVNYAEICDKVYKYSTANTFDLIERLAYGIGEMVLIDYPVINSIEVTVKKPMAPVKHAFDCISVSTSVKYNNVYLSIGSNMGDKEKNLNEAIRMLNEDEKTYVVKQSSFMETEPYGEVEQDNFLNGALHIRTLRNPYELLELIGKIEKQLKRVRTVHWGPRTIDLDIIFYEDLIVNDEKLTIPHKEMHKRDFVITPLCEISPEIVHPIFCENVYNIKRKLDIK